MKTAKKKQKQIAYSKSIYGSKPNLTNVLDKD